MRPRVVERLDLALLDLHTFVVHRSAVDPWWRPRLEAGDLEIQALELFGEMRGRRFAGATARDLRLCPDVNAAAQERSCRHDDGPGAKTPTFERLDTDDPAIVLQHQPRDRALNGAQAAVRLQQLRS